MRTQPSSCGLEFVERRVGGLGDESVEARFQPGRQLTVVTGDRQRLGVRAHELVRLLAGPDVAGLIHDYAVDDRLGRSSARCRRGAPASLWRPAYLRPDFSSLIFAEVHAAQPAPGRLTTNAYP